MNRTLPTYQKISFEVDNYFLLKSFEEYSFTRLIRYLEVKFVISLQSLHEEIKKGICYSSNFHRYYLEKIPRYILDCSIISIYGVNQLSSSSSSTSNSNPSSSSFSLSSSSLLNNNQSWIFSSFQESFIIDFESIVTIVGLKMTIIPSYFDISIINCELPQTQIQLTSINNNDKNSTSSNQSNEVYSSFFFFSFFRSFFLLISSFHCFLFFLVVSLSSITSIKNYD